MSQRIEKLIVPGKRPVKDLLKDLKPSEMSEEEIDSVLEAFQKFHDDLDKDRFDRRRVKGLELALRDIKRLLTRIEVGMDPAEVVQRIKELIDSKLGKEKSDYERERKRKGL